MKSLNIRIKTLVKNIKEIEEHIEHCKLIIETEKNIDEVEKAKGNIIRLNEMLEGYNATLKIFEEEQEKIENAKPMKTRTKIRAEREMIRKCLQGIEDMYKEGKFTEQTYWNEKLEHLGYLNALDFVLEE